MSLEIHDDPLGDLNLADSTMAIMLARIALRHVSNDLPTACSADTLLAAAALVTAAKRDYEKDKNENAH